MFYLGMQLPLLGVVSEEKNMQTALHQQQALGNADSQAAAARDIGSLAIANLTYHDYIRALS